MTAPAALPLGRDSVSWRVAPMGFLGSSRALLLQTSHPRVAAGVAQHSDYRGDPFGRALRTFDVVLKLAFGTPDVSRRQEVRLERRHRPVVGTTSAGEAYDARDPDLALWVWATLVDTALLAHERVHGRLPADERARWYAEQRAFGVGCGVPVELLPPDLDTFHAYVDRVVAEDLARTPEGDDVAHFTFYPMVPRVGAGAAGAFLRWTAAALFPPRVRDLYGLSWTADDERRFTRFCRVLGAVDRAQPDALRSLPMRLVVDHDLLARLERAGRRRARRRKGSSCPA